MTSSLDLFVIAALPKSASSFAWAVASALQEPNGRANPDRLPPEMPDPFISLRPGLLDLFPSGGVYKGHAPVSTATVDFLSKTQGNYAVWVRHPADFICALYCHFVLNRQEFKGNEHWTFLWQAPVRRAMLEYPAIGVDEGLKHLIRDGALAEALRWLANWLTCRDPDRSILVKYEDWAGDLEATASTLSQLIQGCPPSQDVLDYIQYLWTAHADNKRRTEGTYPRGWTGSIGTWRNYLSAENVDHYNSVIEEFLAGYPWSKSLLQVYPELLV